MSDQQLLIGAVSAMALAVAALWGRYEWLNSQVMARLTDCEKDRKQLWKDRERMWRHLARLSGADDAADPTEGNE